MYVSILQILSSLSANVMWPWHISVPVWTELVASKAGKKRWGHWTRAPLQAFSQSLNGKQHLPLLMLHNSSKCFLQRIVSLAKPQARALVPTITDTFPQQSSTTGAGCWTFLFLRSRGALTQNMPITGAFKTRKKSRRRSATFCRLKQRKTGRQPHSLGGKTLISREQSNHYNVNEVQTL